ncbi:TPA: transcriptional regulator GutM [Streptococcus equi subsp. zooepidemicus]|nr:transcriptional regulator GutM [Streptococcus equi subsp. zooepidemicus]HEL0268733.1 transcriptional regulator GutM [Streptococcus equi subsp. zooepidemicus]HEL0270842.1 transcriptional regulator GutM [Streptococcus equi subsp. zooepidemicus]
MSFMVIFGLFVIAAYLFQLLLGLRQLKHFNAVYASLRRQGRVAIGRRAGKIRAGTIVMFALDQSGKVLDARQMQDVTVAARFKPMPAYIGQDIHYFDRYNPLIRRENKLLRLAIEDAREVFLRVEAGVYEDAPKYASAFDWPLQAKQLLARFK